MNSTDTEQILFSVSLTNPKILSLLLRVNGLLPKGVRSYIVGGLVRDSLLRRETVDIDIALSRDALEIASGVADALGGKYILLDSANRVGRVVLVDSELSLERYPLMLDFTTFEEDISHDLGQRDFTIDAMAIDLSQVAIGATDIPLLDPFSGRDDLEHGVIRAVTRTAFASDAVRLLRAVRLAAELDFSIDEETEALIRQSSKLISGIAGERIREELLRLLAVTGAGKYLTYLDELGLLTNIFSELSLAKGVQQPKEHFWNVFDHSLKTVTAVDYLLRQGVWEFTDEEVLNTVPWSDELVEYFDYEVGSGSTRRSLLKLAALLHDISKPQTKAINVDGRMRFLGHAKEGASVVASILERLRFSNREIKLVETMVTHHLRPGQMNQPNEPPTRRAIYRYFRDTGDAGIGILFLSLADHLATRGPHLIPDHWQEHTGVVEYVLSKQAEQESLTHPPKLVDGHDLINIFGMSPGPRLGEILEAVREAQASGEVTDRQEALSFIEKMESMTLS